MTKIDEKYTRLLRMVNTCLSELGRETEHVPMLKITLGSI